MKKQLNGINSNSKVHSFFGHFYYSLGAVPSALPYNVIGSYLAYFYETKQGLSVELFGLLMLLYGLWNAINDPAIGFLMDRKKTRFGRRIPWIITGAIPLALGFTLLWWVPWENSLSIFLHALMMLFLFDLGFTFAISAWVALYTEMYQSEQERASVVALKDTIAFSSSMIGVIFPPLIAANLGWEVMGIIFGLITVITMYLSLLGTKERPEYQIDDPLPIMTAIKSIFKNKPFIWISLTYAMIDFSFGLTMLVFPLYARFTLHLEEEMISLAMVGIVIGILASILFWKRMYSQKGPKEGLMLAMAIYAVGILPFFLVRDIIQMIVVSLIPGFGVGGMLMTEPAISAAIDYDEIQTGKRQEGAYSGILTFIARLSIVLTGIILVIIQLFTGFQTGSEIQPETAEVGLSLLVSIIPSVGIFIGLLFIKLYPLDFRRFKEQQIELKKLHEKRIEFLEL